MKKFNFSLEAVLNLRIDAVKKTQQEMAPIVKRYNDLRIAKERILVTLNQTSKESPSHQISYLQELSTLYRAIEKEELPVKTKLEEWQKILAGKLKDQKVLEILKAHQLKDWEKALGKHNEAEQLELIQSFY